MLAVLAVPHFFRMPSSTSPAHFSFRSNSMQLGPRLPTSKAWMTQYSEVEPNLP
jgi:hypothetical protein